MVNYYFWPLASLFETLNEKLTFCFFYFLLFICFLNFNSPCSALASKSSGRKVDYIHKYYINVFEYEFETRALRKYIFKQRDNMSLLRGYS